MLERIFWLMTEENVTYKKYFKKFEMSRATFERDKRYIRERLWQYKIERRKP